jgi:hypothetical protein
MKAIHIVNGFFLLITCREDFFGKSYFWNRIPIVFRNPKFLIFFYVHNI